ncbi:hypothetical protein BK709_21660 [Bacillus thuringiensis serovar shandongiensis]|nr:hypothetical protein BK717_02110 [Bacillus thuringiensis serovar malayensis]OUB03903.1 hypothetical protein BK709_21660 [Bacillus thuringiensis serovar shandongiensis]
MIRVIFSMVYNKVNVKGISPEIPFIPRFVGSKNLGECEEDRWELLVKGRLVRANNEWVIEQNTD